MYTVERGYLYDGEDWQALGEYVDEFDTLDEAIAFYVSIDLERQHNYCHEASDSEPVGKCIFTELVEGPCGTDYLIYETWKPGEDISKLTSNANEVYFKISDRQDNPDNYKY